MLELFFQFFSKWQHDPSILHRLPMKTLKDLIKNSMKAQISTSMIWENLSPQN